MDDNGWIKLSWQKPGGPFLHWDEELAQLADGRWALFSPDGRRDYVLGVLGRHTHDWTSHMTQSVLSFATREDALRLLPIATRHFFWPESAWRQWPQLGGYNRRRRLRWLNVPNVYGCDRHGSRQALLSGFDGIRLSERRRDEARRRRDAFWYSVSKHKPDYTKADGAYCLLGDKHPCACGAVARFYTDDLWPLAARRAHGTHKLFEELPRRVCVNCFPALQPVAERLWKAFENRRLIRSIERKISEHNRATPREAV